MPLHKRPTLFATNFVGLCRAGLPRPADFLNFVSQFYWWQISVVRHYDFPPLGKVNGAKGRKFLFVTHQNFFGNKSSVAVIK